MFDLDFDETSRLISTWPSWRRAGRLGVGVYKHCPPDGGPCATLRGLRAGIKHSALSFSVFANGSFASDIG